MSLEAFTRERCPELAAFLKDCCASPLSFAGAHPIEHSADNHIHLWSLEYWADHHKWIDLDYRTAFADLILDRWRGRLKGLAPYHADGYRMYLYQDMAPTVSVVAETRFGFPYGGTASFVHGAREIMRLYVERSWRDNFTIEPWEVDDQALLAAVDKHAGSIGKPTANALKISVAALRRLIEQMNLADRVNAIRKRYKRRPAAFEDDETFEHTFAVYEQRLPPGYR
jgi:hypothetical protein